MDILCVSNEIMTYNIVRVLLIKSELLQIQNSGWCSTRDLEVSDSRYSSMYLLLPLSFISCNHRKSNNDIIAWYYFNPVVTSNSQFADWIGTIHVYPLKRVFNIINLLWSLNLEKCAIRFNFLWYHIETSICSIICPIIQGHALKSTLHFKVYIPQNLPMGMRL